MSNALYTEEELRLAVEKVRDAMLSALPDPSECKHDFAPEFQAKMEALLSSSRKQHAGKQIMRRVASVFLALLIGAAVLLAFSPTVRAAVINWVREIYEDSFVYRFFEEEAENNLPLFEPTWIPDGYQKTDDYCSESMRSIQYQREDETKGIIVEYCGASDSTTVAILTDTANQEVEHVVVQGWQAELYLANEQSVTNNLIWVDEKEQIVFGVHGAAEPDVLIKLAESIMKDN